MGHLKCFMHVSTRANTFIPHISEGTGFVWHTSYCLPVPPINGITVSKIWCAFPKVWEMYDTLFIYSYMCQYIPICKILCICWHMHPNSVSHIFHTLEMCKTLFVYWYMCQYMKHYVSVDIYIETVFCTFPKVWKICEILFIYLCMCQYIQMHKTLFIYWCGVNIYRYTMIFVMLLFTKYGFCMKHYFHIHI